MSIDPEEASRELRKSIALMDTLIKKIKDKKETETQRRFYMNCIYASQSMKDFDQKMREG